MRVLISGASGLLGSNLVLTALDAAHEVLPISHTREVSPDGRSADLTQSEAIGDLMAELQPDWVVHCAALTDVDRCERDPELAMALNRDAARHVAKAASQIGASLVHVSTDAVFSGEPGPRKEDDSARPLNVYGSSKLAGEEGVLDEHPGAIVVRTNFYGWSPSGRLSLAEWFLENLRKGQPHAGFTDIRVNPLLANSLSGYLLHMLDLGLSGTYHLGCRDTVSKYEFGHMLAATFNLDPGMIEATTSEEAELLAARPKELSLSVDKIERALSLQMPELIEGMRELQALEVEGYRDRVDSLLLEPSQP